MLLFSFIFVSAREDDITKNFHQLYKPRIVVFFICSKNIHKHTSRSSCYVSQFHSYRYGRHTKYVGT